MSKAFPFLDFLYKSYNSFPKEEYLGIYRKVIIYKDKYPLKFWQFLGSWRSLTFRFAACIDHNKNYVKTVKMHGISPPQPHRYEQERELFNFFTNGLSAIETLGYMIFIICSIAKSDIFKVENDEDLKKISFNRTIKKMRCVDGFKDNQLTNYLESLYNSNEFIDWREIRNTLMHRETPGRIIHVSSGSSNKARKDEWFNGLVKLDVNTTELRLIWLEENLIKIIKLINLFTEEILKKLN